MPTWNPDQYLKFFNERTRPAKDLAAAITVNTPRSILDVGCGPANSTAVLAERWKNARLTGIDSSAAMLETARKKLPDDVFLKRDIEEDLSSLGTFDIVFSNAVLQWLSDGEAAAERLLALVNDGGALAVQVPACAPGKSQEGRLETCDAHRLMYETAEEPDFALYTKGVTRFFDFTGDRLYSRLSSKAVKMDMWETRYCHVLDGYEGLAEWYRGTGMRPYLDKLPSEELKTRFEKNFLERAAAEFPLTADGKLLFWFRRLFFIAYK